MHNWMVEFHGISNRNNVHYKAKAVDYLLLQSIISLLIFHHHVSVCINSSVDG